MKNILIVFIATLLFTGCNVYQTPGLQRLTIGMTKAEVRNIAGYPERVLAVNQTQYGYQEVLEYRMNNNDYYALEFWDDYLTGFEFLYEGITYIPAPAPPTVWPIYGRPVFTGNYRPSRPKNPQYPGQDNRPPGTTRPPSTNTGTPTPGVNNRPENTGRPQNNTNTNSRPSTNTNNNTNTQQDNNSTRRSQQSTTTESSGSSQSTRSSSSGSSSTNSNTNTNSERTNSNTRR